MIALPKRAERGGFGMKSFSHFLGIRTVLRLPTSDLSGARAILDLHENKIKALADDGTLPAWNITRDPRGASARTERRFLTRAVRDLAEGRPVTCDEDLIVTLLYGRQRPVILGKDFSRSWNCDSGHVCNLIEDGTLQLAQGTSYGRGRGCTSEITWASALAFMRDRRL
jgi:hypothetical protein